MILDKKNTVEDSLEMCLTCLRKAILLAKSDSKRAEFYCNLSKVFIETGDFQKVQHCLIRSIQLNRQCDTAWCMLSLLYLHFELYDDAHNAAINAQKINPRLPEAWCSQALHAQWSLFKNDFQDECKEGDNYKSQCLEIKELFEQAIVLDPMCMEIRSFALDFCHRLHSIAVKKMDEDEGNITKLQNDGVPDSE